ncbi:MAG: PPC domain-containing protein [Myxococcota bacterium]
MTPRKTIIAPLASFTSLVTATAFAALAGCDDGQTTAAPDLASAPSAKGDSSVEAVFLEFNFDGKLRTSSCWDNKTAIQDQLLFTIGQLNGDRAVGRLDTAELTNIKRTVEGDGSHCAITYHARLPVTWAQKSAIPARYDFKLPADMSSDKVEAFTTKYKTKCAEAGAHDVDSGSLFYYWRPNNSGCKLADADALRARATVTASTLGTTGKYPEYHKVWEDNVLRVVAVFGKYEDGATTSADAGIEAFNTFVASVKSELKNKNLVTTPATVPVAPGVSTPDITFDADLGGGKKVSIVALLVDNVRQGGPAFNARYEALSTKADVITYNGHAGLGSNVRFLASQGEWVKGQYVIVFMNGCDTQAYVDNALSAAHVAVNDDDTTGNKYVDIVTNGMPAFFANMSASTMAIVRGLLAWDAPRTYEQIFKNISSSQVVLVSGEQDNVYYPGYTPGGTPVDPGTGAWAGMSERGTVATDEEKAFSTPTLAAGKYLFELAGDGDADLYVRIGSAPTADTYDCRPYLTGSAETCEVTLDGAAKVFVSVRGYEGPASFTLVGQTDADR